MQNVLNALRVLDEVAARQPVGVAELARTLGIPKSTVQRALLTLQTAGWLRPADGGGATRWILTTKPLLMGRHGSGELGLRDVAVPVMEELRRQSDETVHLAVPEGGKVVLIERLETSQPVRIILPLGKDLPLHASANGKAVLAASAPDVIERHLAEELPQFTGTTITDLGRLRAELAAVRERGYATNDGEWRTDVSAVAAAVVVGPGGPVASISVNVPTSRVTSDSRAAHGEMVREAAAKVGAALGSSRGRPSRDAPPRQTP
ncbi:IclR family transcriptional regulator [Streptomyces pinistramenti]|uniref:IclR family transcriptional regulator n=1 Tax=Streptomyces pinistramenti TaxID=2884812 RepID=UPI001D0942A8|nr:IclR family transcriptional regulator [Streptomyces pinistramenti]MCB5908918.1 IclR family transcriptional regulator [Streptomyces pinistramenti]